VSGEDGDATDAESEDEDSEDDGVDQGAFVDEWKPFEAAKRWSSAEDGGPWHMRTWSPARAILLAQHAQHAQAPPSGIAHVLLGVRRDVETLKDRVQATMAAAHASVADRVSAYFAAAASPAPSLLPQARPSPMPAEVHTSIFGLRERALAALTQARASRTAAQSVLE
jgi:hypothetical protein